MSDVLAARAADAAARHGSPSPPSHRNSLSLCTLARTIRGRRKEGDTRHGGSGVRTPAARTASSSSTNSSPTQTTVRGVELYTRARPHDAALPTPPRPHAPHALAHAPVAHQRDQRGRAPTERRGHPRHYRQLPTQQVRTQTHTPRHTRTHTSHTLVGPWPDQGQTMPKHGLDAATDRTGTPDTGHLGGDMAYAPTPRALSTSPQWPGGLGTSGPAGPPASCPRRTQEEERRGPRRRNPPRLDFRSDRRPRW
uniref:Uncharacterized protein n=1 Tax=Aegilops tauschii subsp. strangulata TaxID=200361 RepID=A0A453LUC1_AEGTS